MAAAEILEILSPGALTSIQDLGRYGYGRFGVAPSGALDAFALRIANLLVGNRQDQACFEAMLLGPRVKALTDIVVSLTGGDLQPRRNGQPIHMWRSHVFKKDDILSFKAPLSGFRAYLAVAGGIGVPVVMGSKSTNLPSGFGGYQGRQLKKGDILRSESTGSGLSLAGRAIDSQWIPQYSNKWTLRVIWGPQDDHFPDQSRDLFLNAAYKMSPESDRTGIRLQGPVIQRKADIEESIISEGVVCGSIQIPGDGKPIIILGETVTGGYRKIATVISADLPLLGQIKPGDEVRFAAVSLEASHRALRDAEDLIRRIEQSLTA
ncbi:MAG: biotin-dependent carboxyltransferase family protein [Desulfobacterales bacterium]|nr:MAG: biotin-dependent carboxyltransferase family protein [Desulfobacterales bacterium]